VGPSVTLTDLRFSYTGGNCNGLVDCDDRNDGPNGLEQVYIEISDREFGAYIARVVTLGEVIDVSNPSGFTRELIDIRIETVEPGNNGDNRGDRFQDVEIDIRCLEPEISSDEGALVLGNDYGALTLTSFENDQDGLQSLFAEVQIVYAVSNPSVVGAIINSAIVSSFFSGSGQQLITSPLTLERLSDRTLLTESKVLNLQNESESGPFVFGINVAGVADFTSGGLRCSDYPVYFFEVAAVLIEP
jgi:hypothetical protein